MGREVHVYYFFCTIEDGSVNKKRLPFFGLSCLLNLAFS